MILHLAMMTVLFFEWTSRIDIENRVTAWLGNISFELYCCQGLFLVLFGKLGVADTSGFVFGALVFCCSVLFARMMHPIFQFVMKHFRLA